MGRQITALKVQEHNRERVNVYLDGEFAFGLARIVAAWLQVGQDLSDEKMAALLAEDGQEKAYQQALEFLSYRPRSEAEVQKNLRDHVIPEAVIAETIERLQRNGLVDDSAFAQAWVENRNTFRPRSRRALAAELRQKGLSSEIIAESLQAVDEEALAYQMALKQVRKLQDLKWPEFRRKLTGQLARRGFAYDTIASAVERVWAEIRSANNAGDHPEM